MSVGELPTGELQLSWTEVKGLVGLDGFVLG